MRPRDEVEEQLVAIWEDLLQIRPIGVTDDFFDLGGHSLLAVRLAARIEEQFGRSLALSDLLLGSTIEELAARLREPVGSRGGSPLVDLGATGPGRPLYPRASDRRRRSLLQRAGPLTSMGREAFSVSRPPALKVRRSPRRTSCAWRHDTSMPFARIVLQGLTSWAVGRWGASWRSRWPASSPPRGMTYRSSF